MPKVTHSCNWQGGAGRRLAASVPLCMDLPMELRECPSDFCSVFIQEAKVEAPMPLITLALEVTHLHFHCIQLVVAMT